MAGPCKVIGARVPGGKLGPGRSRGTATLVLHTRSSAHNVEPRGGAGVHVNNVAHCGAQRPKYPWLGPTPIPQYLMWPRLVPDELIPLLNEYKLPH